MAVSLEMYQRVGARVGECGMMLYIKSQSQRSQEPTICTKLFCSLVFCVVVQTMTWFYF